MTDRALVSVVGRNGPGSGTRRALLAHMGDARRLLISGYGLIVVDAVAQVSAPLVFREVLNRIETDPERFVGGGWRGPALAALVVAVTFVAAAYLAHTSNRRGAARWAHHLRCRLYEHVQRLSIDFFHRSHAGEVAARINQDIERLELAVWHGLALVWASVMLLVGVGLVTWIDAWMGLLALVLLALAAVWTRAIAPRLRDRSRAVRDALGATSASVAELVGVNPLIKAFNAEDQAAEQVGADSRRALDGAESLARLQFRYSDLMGFHLAFAAPFVLRSAWCSRRTSCSAAAWPGTSAWPSQTPATRSCARRSRPRTRGSSSAAGTPGWTPRWASGEPCCPAASASGWRSPG